MFKKILTGLAAFLLASGSVCANPPITWGPNNSALLLTPNLAMSDTTNGGLSSSILTGSSDPTTVAQDAKKGSLYLRNGAGGGVFYIKQDDGLSTNWTLVAAAANVVLSNGSATTLNAITRFADTTGHLVYNSAATISNAGLLTTSDLACSNQTATTVPYFDASKKLVSSAVTPTELGYLSGVTSAVQTQLGAKQSTTLTNTHLLVGNVSNVATDVALSGDATLANTGALSIAKIQGTVVSGTTGSTNVVFSSAPTLTNPVVGTQAALDSSTKAASTAYVDTAVSTAAGSYLLKASNLSDVGSASTAFNNISPMTTLGDIIYGGASGTRTRLAGNTSATKNFLSQTGTGTVSAAPVWGTLAAGDIPNLPASIITSGTLATAQGGTNLNTSGSTGVAKVSSGTWSVAALIASEIPNLDASKITTGLLATARGGTNVDSSAFTGVAKVSSGTWSAATLVDADVSSSAAIAQSKLAAPSVKTKTTTYTILAADQAIGFDSSGGIYTATLPAANAAGNLTKHLFKTTNDFSAVTIARAGSDTIVFNGSTVNTSLTLNTVDESYDLVPDGTSKWYVVQHKTGTDWFNFSPTLVSFGTATSVDAWWRRVGNGIEEYISFTSGTVTNTESRWPLPSGLTSDSTRIASIKITGFGDSTAVAAVNWTMLIESGVTYTTFGIQAGTQGGLTKTTGTTAFQNATSYAFTTTHAIPISGWLP